MGNKMKNTTLIYGFGLLILAGVAGYFIFPAFIKPQTEGDKQLDTSVNEVEKALDKTAENAKKNAASALGFWAKSENYYQSEEIPWYVFGPIRSVYSGYLALTEDNANE